MKCPRGKTSVFDHIIKTSITVHEHQGVNGGCLIISTFSISPLLVFWSVFLKQHWTTFSKALVSWAARPEWCCKTGQPSKGRLEHHWRWQCSKGKRKDEIHQSWALRQPHFKGVFVSEVFFAISPLASECEEVTWHKPWSQALETNRHTAHRVCSLAPKPLKHGEAPSATKVFMVLQAEGIQLH